MRTTANMFTLRRVPLKVSSCCEGVLPATVATLYLNSCWTNKEDRDKLLGSK